MSAERTWANSAVAGLLLLDRRGFRDPADRPQISLREKARP